MQSIDESEEMRYSYLRMNAGQEELDAKKRRNQKRKQGRQDSDNSAAWDFVCCLLSGIFFAGKICSFSKRAGRNPSLSPDFNRTILEFSSRARCVQYSIAARAFGGTDWSRAFGSGSLLSGLFQNPMVSPDVLAPQRELVLVRHWEFCWAFPILTFLPFPSSAVLVRCCWCSWLRPR